MPTMARPEVDVLEGLTTAIIVDQERMAGDGRSTVGTATDATAMLRILSAGSGSRTSARPARTPSTSPRSRRAGGSRSQRGDKTITKAASFNRLGGMCPRCEGRGSVNDFDLSALYDDSKSLDEGALTIPGYNMDGWYGRIYRGCGYFDPDKPISEFNKKEMNDLLYKEPTKIKVDGVNLTYAGLIPQIQKSFLSKDIDALQPHIRRFVEQAVVLPPAPMRRHPAGRGGSLVEDQGDQHRRRLRDADHRSGRLARRRKGEVRGAADRGAAAHARLVRRDRPRLPEPRPPVGNALGRRGAAHQDDPPARLLADRRDLRLRRADHRPSPARHRADERAAAAAARQGQHGARGGAQAGGDRERRPRRRPRPRRGQRRRRGGVRGHRRGAACQRHRDRPHLDDRASLRSGASFGRRRWRYAAPTPTTCRTSTWTFRSACSSW